MSDIKDKIYYGLKGIKRKLLRTADGDEMAEVRIIVKSEYFDWKWYTERYHLPCKNANEAAKHYYEKGWERYYDPSDKFVTILYLLDYEDVKAAHVNPLWHYEKFGKGEGRKLHDIKKIKEEYKLVKESGYFDETWYKETYHVDKETDAVYHYLCIDGEGYKDPSKDFSSIDYMINNMKTVWELQNPLIHYEKNKNNGQKFIIKKVGERAGRQNDSKCAYVNREKLDKLAKYNRAEVAKHVDSVDIVICVYNAYEDVKRCIESVLEHTTEPYHIIIVDDNSAELTASYLRGIAEENRDIELIRNESDFHGYTYAANIGLRNSKADYCIMLNSDTIVSEHWLDNMIACAKSDEKIGVVGPLSNTASWQSVPKLVDEDGDWCHNVIPEDFTISQVADMIEQYSGRIYPKVPLLNGFCLMISRKVIDEIGYFDEENFGRGFAEEDDYNTRAVKAGFELAIADDTYIFHAQSKSYTDEKRLALCKLSGESLRKKHGQEYIDHCSVFMAQNKVLDSIRKRVEIMIESERICRRCHQKYGGKKILFLLPGGEAGGGANVVIQESMALLKMGIEVTFLNTESNRSSYEKTYGDINIPVIWMKSYAEFDYKLAKGYDVVVCTLFRTVEYCKFLDKYEKPKVVYYIQDYEPYFIQEEIVDGDYDHEEYEKAVKSYTLMQNCINVTKTQWNRDEVKKNTGAESIILGPSFNNKLFMPRAAQENRRIVVTAMLRPSTVRRGPQMTYDVLRQLGLKYKNKIDIRVFGSDPEHDMRSEIFYTRQERDFSYTNYGLTTPEQTAGILAESDVFLDLSQFQAMGLTAMEAMACGCAVVVPQNGGTGCFARHEENCLVIDTLDFDTCVKNAERLIDDWSLRDKLRRQAYKDIAEYYPEKVAERLINAVYH